MAISFGSKSSGRTEPALADSRDARLSRSLSGTNLERAGDYNLRAVLQAVRLNGDTTRAAIARQTGLTAPTIANITTRLVDMGLVRHAGRMQGGGASRRCACRSIPTAPSRSASTSIAII